jgi:site-specific recombinase
VTEITDELLLLQVQNFALGHIVNASFKVIPKQIWKNHKRNQKEYLKRRNSDRTKKYWGGGGGGVKIGWLKKKKKKLKIFIKNFINLV